MINPRIRKLLPLIRNFMANHPVKRAWLFGSCSRGEETDKSDIDILVDYDNSNGIVSLFTMGGMLMDLTDLLGCPVDLVDNKGLCGFVKKSVEEDKILIYERAN